MPLVVDDEEFASRYAACLTAATGLPARLEAVSRPSGQLRRDVAGFRVRVVSSYLADLMRQYPGGDAPHVRQRFPRVVLRDISTFEGFLDGYVEGDGFRHKDWGGRTVVSANVPFLAEPARVIGARFTPCPRGTRSALVITDRWRARGTFAPEQHALELVESEWVGVEDVRLRRAEGESRSPSTATASPRTPAFRSTATSRVRPGEGHAGVAAPLLWSSSSSGSLQTRSRNRAAAMTPMPATTEKPA